MESEGRHFQNPQLLFYTLPSPPSCMDIDESLIRRVAKVARLDLSNQEVRAFIPQFKEILEHFSLLREADVSGIQPVFHPVEIEGRERKDEPKTGLTNEEALSLTPHRQDGYFKGPKVMK